MNNRISETEPPIGRAQEPALFILLLLSFPSLFLHFAAAMRDRVIWRDEAHALNLASASWSEFAHLFAFVEHQTSYLVALRIWTMLFGTSAWAASLFSLLCSISAAVILFFLVRMIWKSLPAAGIAAALLVLSPVLARYNVFAVRPYAFALMTNMLAALATWRLYTDPRARNWLFLGLSLLMSTNAQPVNMAFCGSLCVMYLIATLSSADWRNVRSWIAGISYGVLVLVAATPMLRQSIRFAHAMEGVEPRQEIGAIGLGIAGKFIFSTTEAIVPPLRNGIEMILGYDPGMSMRLLLSHPATLLCVVALILFVVWPLTRAQKSVFALIGISLFQAALLLFASLLHVRMIELNRSFSTMAPAIAVGIGIALARYPRAANILLALLLARSLALLPLFSDRQPGHLSDAREAASFMDRHAVSNDVVLLANPQLSPAFAYYFKGRQQQLHHPYAGPIRFWDMVDFGHRVQDPKYLENTLETIGSAMDAGRRVWLVTSGSPAPEPNKYWYCPKDLPAIESFLESRARPLAQWVGPSRLEPFHLTLYQAAGTSGEPSRYHREP